MKKNLYKLGTRSSDLALRQAQLIQSKLLTVEGVSVEISPSTTEGDLKQAVPLSSLGGKGVFVKDLETRLIHGEVDFLVHSLKDVTSVLEEGLSLIAFFEGPSVRDCLIFSEAFRGDSLDDLPQGARVGTGSLRRKALLNRLRPDLELVDIRGNIQTRLNKLEKEGLDALVLAEAGLMRLGLEASIGFSFDPMTFVPAPGQGALAIEAYDDRDDLKSDFSSLLDLDFIRLRQLEFDLISDIGLTCNYPLGCYFYYQDGKGFCRIFLADFDLNVKLDTLWSFHVSEADSFVAEKKAYLRTFL